MNHQDLAEHIANASVAECKKILLESYENAGVSGLCEEGRFEVAVASLNPLALQKIILDLLKKVRRNNLC